MSHVYTRNSCHLGKHRSLHMALSTSPAHLRCPLRLLASPTHFPYQRRKPPQPLATKTVLKQLCWAPRFVKRLNFEQNVRGCCQCWQLAIESYPSRPRAVIYPPKKSLPSGILVSTPMWSHPFVQPSSRAPGTCPRSRSNALPPLHGCSPTRTYSRDPNPTRPFYHVPQQYMPQPSSAPTPKFPHPHVHRSLRAHNAV